MEQNQNNDESKRNPTECNEGADQPLLSAGFGQVKFTSEQIEAINKMGIALRDGINIFCKALSDIGVKALKSCNTAMMQHIKIEYLKTHNRLPGSDRTKRLRKKQRSKLVGWYTKACR